MADAGSSTRSRDMSSTLLVAMSAPMPPTTPASQPSSTWQPAVMLTSPARIPVDRLSAVYLPVRTRE
jgi:hypothetical protein